MFRVGWDGGVGMGGAGGIAGWLCSWASELRAGVGGDPRSWGLELVLGLERREALNTGG